MPPCRRRSRRSPALSQWNCSCEPAMEEQFILRVPPSVAERIERLMNESAAASSSSNPDDTSLDLSFSGQRRPRLSPSIPALFCAKTYRALG